MQSEDPDRVCRPSVLVTCQEARTKIPYTNNFRKEEFMTHFKGTVYHGGELMVAGVWPLVTLNVSGNRALTAATEPLVLFFQSWTQSI